MTGREFQHSSVAETSECVSRFQIERYVLGELSPAETQRIEAHLSACSRCQRRVDDLHQERQAFLERVPFERFYNDLEQRFSQEELDARGEEQTAEPVGPGSFHAWWHRTWARVLEALRFLSGPQWAVAAVAVVALIMVVPRIGHVVGPNDPGVRVKSPVSSPGPLEVILLRNGRITQPESGDVFYAGDRLQFRVTPGTWRYLHLVSLDDQGRLTPFFPDDGSPSIELRPEAEQLLPDAIVLDDFVGQERIFAVFSVEPLPYATVEAAARDLVHSMTFPLDLTGITQLPIDGTAQASFLMIKE